MCGIFGHIGQLERPHWLFAHRLLRELAIAHECRGTDASGYAALFAEGHLLCAEGTEVTGRTRSQQMQVRITRASRSLSGGTWYVGTVGRYRFEALASAPPSQYGIEGSQVSKRCLLDGPRKQGGRELACYERGWQLRPDEAAPALDVDWREVGEAIGHVVVEVGQRGAGGVLDGHQGIGG